MRGSTGQDRPGQKSNQEHMRAAQLLNEGRIAEAQGIMEGLRSELGMDPLFLFNLANLYWATNQAALAIRFYRQALALKPDFVDAMVNLSNALSTAGDKREALRYIQMALRRAPNDHRLLTNLACLLNIMGEGPHAWQAIEHAYQIAPDEHKVAVTRMSIASDLKKIDVIESACVHAIKTGRGEGDVNPYLTLCTHLAKFSRWDDLDKATRDLCETTDRRIAAGKSLSLLPMQYTFVTDRLDYVEYTAVEVRGSGRSLMRARTRYVPGKEKIHIGYLSPDLRQHPVARMLIPVLRQHDRSKFRIVTLSTLPADGSDLSQEIGKLSDQRIDLSQVDDSGAAELIRQAGIDILVDLAGSTQWYRPGMLAIRSAPVQALWLGCPSTTGAEWYDAFLVDGVAVGPAYRKACTEPLVDLPCCYHPISTGMGEPDPSIDRAAVGLPAGDFIIGLLQLPGKVRPPFTEDLAEILRRAPHAKLWLRAEPGGWDHVRAYFRDRGVDPARVLFYPKALERSQYLATFGLPDLLIDSFPYGGHSTTGEAIAMGHPVVTRTGDCMHTRVGASMLVHAGLGDLVAADKASYIDLVVALASDPRRLAEVRLRCKAAAERCRADASGTLTRALEAEYERLIGAAASGGAT